MTRPDLARVAALLEQAAAILRAASDEPTITMAAARVVGVYLDRVVSARPQIKVVR